MLGTVIYGARMDGGGATNVHEYYRGVVIDTQFQCMCYRLFKWLVLKYMIALVIYLLFH